MRLGQDANTSNAGTAIRRLPKSTTYVLIGIDNGTIRDRLIVGKEKSCMNTKRWYTSKTLWVNLLAIAAFIAQGQFGYLLDAEAQAALLAIINLILRIITKKGLS